MSDEETKAALKQALKEWLDEKFTTFGKWSAGMFGATILVGVVYFLLWVNGWHK